MGLRVAGRRRRDGAGASAGGRTADHVPHRRPGIVLGGRARRGTPLGERGGRHRPAVRRPVRDGRRRGSQQRADLLAAVATALADASGPAPRRRRRTDRRRVRLPPLERPAVRPADAGLPVRVRRAAAGGPGRTLAPSQHRIRARDLVGLDPFGPDLDAAPGTVVDRDAASPPCLGTRGRARMDQRVARSRARARARLPARRPRSATGRSRSWRTRRPFRARCSTSGSGRFSGCRRSAT